MNNIIVLVMHACARVQYYLMSCIIYIYIVAVLYDLQVPISIRSFKGLKN